MICCTSVVLPAPGAPAMRLNENSGTPPPRTASSPGMPVARRRIGTLSVMSWSPGNVPLEVVRPRVAQQTGRQALADQRGQQLTEGGHYGHCGLGGHGGLSLLQKSLRAAEQAA